MDAIELLRQEHRDIGRVLDRLEQAISAAKTGAQVNVVLFDRVAEFLRKHVESNHHLKENALHGMLRQAGVSSHNRVMGQLNDEHALGREMTEELQRTSRAVLRGEMELEVLLASAQSYIRMHRLHTQVEEREFLPTAQRLLGPEALSRVWARFARIEGRSGSVADAAAALDLAFGTEVRR